MDDIVNDICREFRRLRDEWGDLGNDAFTAAIRQELKRFWDEQPWYIRILRKPIMRLVYRQLRDI